MKTTPWVILTPSTSTLLCGDQTRNNADEQPIREEEVEDAKDEGRAQGSGKEEGNGVQRGSSL